MTDEKKTPAQPVNFGKKVVGEVELPKLNLDPYIGRDATIEKVEEYEGKHGPYVKVSSSIIDTVEMGKEKIDLRASKILGLVETEVDGKMVIGWGSESKTAAFLKSKDVKHYRDLVGKDVKVQTQLTNDTTFLTF